MKVFRKEVRSIIIDGNLFYYVVNENNKNVKFRAYSGKYKTSFSEVIFTWTYNWNINLYEPKTAEKLIRYALDNGWNGLREKQAAKLLGDIYLIEKLKVNKEGDKMKYTVESIQKEFSKGKHLKYLFFWGHQPSRDGSITKSCFSQWWSCSFVVDEEEYHSAEQYMMAEKAKLFGDHEIRKQILECKHPKQAKALGRKVKGFKEEIWGEKCFDIVKAGNMAKFSQNEELYEFLITTKQRVLVEASPVDKIWGIGLATDDSQIENPLTWKGTNLLGFALMEVRDELSK